MSKDNRKIVEARVLMSGDSKTFMIMIESEDELTMEEVFEAVLTFVTPDLSEDEDGDSTLQ